MIEKLERTDMMREALKNGSVLFSLSEPITYDLNSPCLHSPPCNPWFVTLHMLQLLIFKP
jgi:hypothetical protein